ncbi:hypothetical protein AcW1_005649 [Taiwanofungus camphoratus]|nr:hypothetical protein AcW2_004413 [Antrodia cinnamomea]KAI0933153.1 hypothetical protein AcV7_004708 [Antrodia cinnamomea]KAI0933980.1 hypothetical protein AcV5_010491 [Antrodia cinnamomea]KAI0957176.1 hypothetical protein AcW1_005649 [Antrodia cinnamomea]
MNALGLDNSSFAQLQSDLYYALANYNQQNEIHWINEYGTTDQSHITVINESNCSSYTSLQHALQIQLVPVPQRMYRPTSGRPLSLHPSVKFRWSGQLGIRLKDALSPGFAQLERRNDLAFPDMRNYKLSLRLEWPVKAQPGPNDYYPYSRQITVRDSTKASQPITVAKLAKKVADELLRFIHDSERNLWEDDKWRKGAYNPSCA